MSDLMSDLSYMDLFKFYNFIGNIFRANIDPDDRAARVVTEKYQNDSVITKSEEDYVKTTILTEDVKSITKPYTTIIGSKEVRLYLIEEEKLKLRSNIRFDVFTKPLSNTFSDFNKKMILFVNKNMFKMDNMHNNKDDKRTVVDLFETIFVAFLGHNYNARLLSRIMGCMFAYQATCKQLQPEDLYEREDVNCFDIIFKVIKQGDMESYNIPMINENPEIQKLIARTIEDSLAWN